MTPIPSPADRAAAVAALPDRIAFLGFGLIGGSVALAIREAGYRGRIAAWTPKRRGPAEAAGRGIVDAAPVSAEVALDGAGLVILAGPPLAIIWTLDSLAGHWRRALSDEATITDVGSTKARIGEAADAHRLAFVGGHPMAGREVTGVQGATADLFIDRPWVVVPGACVGPSDIELVEALARATGARPRTLDARTHDAAVATISHLPLLLSAALAGSVADDLDGAAITSSWPVARELAATGWADMTRLSKGDPTMGADIFATNGPEVARRLGKLIGHLHGWVDLLRADPPNAKALRKALEEAQASLSDERAAAVAAWTEGDEEERG